jgi:hypothetical protein
MSEERVRQALREARVEATPFAAVIVVANVALALASREVGWELFGAADWWIWLVLAVPSGVLVASMWTGFTQHHDARRRRIEVIGLLGLVALGNAVGIGCVIVSLTHWEPSGLQLLTTAAVVLVTNAVTFALCFWALDSGGPVARALAERRTAPDFQFPQDDNPQLAPAEWEPRLPDYAYLSLTNSLAFSPTDAMPLSHVAKLMMATESLVSVVTILLVAARAINILD